MYSPVLHPTWCTLTQTMCSCKTARLRLRSLRNPSLGYSKRGPRGNRCRPVHAAKEDVTVQDQRSSHPGSSLHRQFQGKLLAPSRVAKLHGLIEDQAAGVLQDMHGEPMGVSSDQQASSSNSTHSKSFEAAMQQLIAASDACVIDVPSKFQAEAVALSTNVDSGRVAHIVAAGKALKLRPVFQPSELHSVGKAVVACAAEMYRHSEQMLASATSMTAASPLDPPAKQVKAAKQSNPAKKPGSRSKKGDAPSIDNLKISYATQARIHAYDLSSLHGLWRLGARQLSIICLQDIASESDDLMGQEQDIDDAMMPATSTSSTKSIVAARHGRRASRQATGRVSLVMCLHPNCAASATHRRLLFALYEPHTRSMSSWRYSAVSKQLDLHLHSGGIPGDSCKRGTAGPRTCNVSANSHRWVRHHDP